MFGRSEVMTVNHNSVAGFALRLARSISTLASTINSQGQVAGWYGNADGTFAAFLFTP